MNIIKLDEHCSQEMSLYFSGWYATGYSAVEVSAVLNMLLLVCGRPRDLRMKTMPDDKSKRGPADASRINIHEDYEVRYWSQHLGVTPERLKEAVRVAGPMVKDVKRHLGL